MTIKLPEEVAKRFNKILQGQIYSVAQPAAVVIQQFATQLVSSLAPAINRIAEVAREIERESRVVGPPLRQAGFWVPFHSSERFVGDLRDIASHESNPTSKIRERFLAEYHKNDFELLRDIVDSWTELRYFEGRKAVLASAMNAHIRGEYELSIPALLPAIEGVLSSIAGTDHRKPRGQAIGLFAKEVIDERYTSFFADISKNAILEFVTGHSFYGTVNPDFFHPDLYNEWLEEKGIDPLQTLNRHAILHGVQKSYASPENSLRAFLLLDVLTELSKPKH